MDQSKTARTYRRVTGSTVQGTHGDATGIAVCLADDDGQGFGSGAKGGRTLHYVDDRRPPATERRRTPPAATGWLGHAAMNDQTGTENSGLRRVIGGVAVLNLGYFAVEFVVALTIGSVSLFADSIDFLEDTSVNLLILIALGWTVRNRARLGMALAAILLVPGVATLWMAWQKFRVPVAPDAASLSLTGLGALAVNLSCAVMLARYRHHGGSLTKAAFLSARNDAFANLAIIAAAVVTATLWQSAWPDLIVGLGIAAMNADAAREVWGAARREHRAAA